MNESNTRNESVAPDYDLEVFKFYVNGFVQYSLLLVASTVGVFSPLLIIVGPHMNSFFLGSLIFVYLIFSVISGYSLSRLVGIFVLMNLAMPEEMKKRHSKLAGIDYFSMGKHTRATKYAAKKSTQVLLGIIPVIVYVVLLVSALE